MISDGSSSECFLISPVDIIVTLSSLMLMLVVVKVSLMKLIPSVVVIVTIVISPTLVGVVVSPMLVLLPVELLLIVGSLLLLLREMLLIVHDRRLPVLLLLSRWLVSSLLVGLSVSHAWVVEVVKGRVDVAHMTPSLHHHGWLLMLLLLLLWPGWSIHHLILNVSQCLHARHCGW